MTAGDGWVFTARARRDFRRLDPPIQRRITDALDRLVADPPQGDITRLASTYLGPGTSLQDRVTVKEVLPSLEEAEREVAMLNALAGDQDRTYFWQYTRYCPRSEGL